MTLFFLTCTAVGGVVLLAQLVLSTLGAAHIDVHHDAASSDGLQLLSIRALSAGVAFLGVGGLAAGAMGWSAVPSILAGALVGLVAMAGTARAMRAMLGMQSDGSVHIEGAIGLAATVYVPVPASLSGMGKVTLTLQGRTVEYQAVTPENTMLPTGTNVVVVDIRNHDTVEVVPLPTVDGVS